MELSSISAILRLSNKYDCPPIRQDVCRRLRTDLPNTLQGWDLVREEQVIAVTASDALGGFSFMSIAIAHKNDLRIILPAAYLFHITSYSTVSCQLFYLFVHFTCRIGSNSGWESRPQMAGISEITSYRPSHLLTRAREDPSSPVKPHF